MMEVSLEELLDLDPETRLARLGAAVVGLSTFDDHPGQKGLEGDPGPGRNTLIGIGRGILINVSGRLQSSVCSGADDNKLSNLVGNALTAGKFALAACLLDIMVGMGAPVATATIVAACVAAAICDATYDELCSAWATFNAQLSK